MSSSSEPLERPGLFWEERPRRLDLPDAEVVYHECVELPDAPDHLLQRLTTETPWEQRTIRLWGKEYLQPRLIAWYGDPDCDYSYSGTNLSPTPWTGLIRELKEVAEAVAGEPFNSALLNLYRDHRDSMGLHSDDEPELGPSPTIASLSLGAERVFVLKHREKRIQPVRIRLASGSLLLMKGETQRFWKHGIHKQTKPCGPRLNITFRRIV